MNVRLLPVHAKVADTTTMPLELRQRLPSGWQLSEHQVKTYEALLNRQAEVVFNTALTGDGKSLAAYLPVLINDYHAFGMYPTIELSRDQARQFEGYCRNFQCWVSHLPL
jgi:CRISPR-associated endonuclease/helicase Cas3